MSTAKELKAIKTEISSEDFEGRTDKTNQIIFTIDPSDAKDIDESDQIGLTSFDYFISFY